MTPATLTVALQAASAKAGLVVGYEVTHGSKVVVCRKTYSTFEVPNERCAEWLVKFLTKKGMRASLIKPGAHGDEWLVSYGNGYVENRSIPFAQRPF
jgi:hypothetical protein